MKTAEQLINDYAVGVIQPEDLTNAEIQMMIDELDNQLNSRKRPNLKVVYPEDLDPNYTNKDTELEKRLKNGN